eukprot:TRINITY_DN19325_c0_g1_i1.p1 TRINITY_DN19325_c0_g1~~TRINITY_DN19325_c0_g1_i1.p1  ORF type:complete len:584 (-),score=137.42 TRINITY_DN19325_c0_g1_i1:308-2059(-)
MAIFMEDRLQWILFTAASAWVCSGSRPMLATLLGSGAGLLSVHYGFLLWKTLKATVLGPLTWRPLSRLAVLRALEREEFFRIDGAPEDVAKTREAAFDKLSADWKKKWPKARETQEYLYKHFSDLRFKASGFESTHPIFQKVVNEALDMICVVEKSEGVELTDVDGVKYLDGSGSYGVNCFGFTKTKEFLQAGMQLASQLGPCLGPMHPIVAENIKMILKVYQKEDDGEVSFHMSGTEAVMSAVYQARFHSQKRLVVAFQGTYHGWWDGVMQGAGNDRFASDMLVLKDQSPESLELLKLRASEIACVLVNPISGFGWKNAPTSKLETAKVNAGEESIQAFKKWLEQLRETCTASGITMIFDEIWTFQLGQGGAQELYGVKPDLICLGKALGGGHAVGCVVGPSRLMERRDPVRPMRVNFAVGTFKGNPIVMGSMNAALKFVTSADAAVKFNGLRDRVSKWVVAGNKALQKEDLPIRIAAYRSTWCICYDQASAYNFLFQYYLRDEGLQMCWVGTGKMLLNIEFSEADLERLTDLIIRAGKRFKQDGWWWSGSQPVKLLPFILGPTVQYHVNNLMTALGLAGKK